MRENKFGKFPNIETLLTLVTLPDSLTDSLTGIYQLFNGEIIMTINQSVRAKQLDNNREEPSMTLPPASLSRTLQKWITAEVAAWRRGEAYRARLNPDYQGTHADWLDTTGRARFTQFVNEFKIAKPVKLHNPFLVLTRGYRSAAASRNSHFYTGTSHMMVEQPGQLPWVDHPEMWKTADGEIIFTSFPYHVDADECHAVAATNGLLVEIRPDLNFYHEGTTCVVWRAD